MIDFDKLPDKVICPICDRKFDQMTIVHLRKHGYNNREDFLKEYPNFIFHSKHFSKCSTNAQKVRWSKEGSRDKARENYNRTMSKYYSSEDNRRKKSIEMTQKWKEKSYREKVNKSRWNEENRNKFKSIASSLHSKMIEKHYDDVCKNLLKSHGMIRNITLSSGIKVSIKSRWEEKVIRYLDENKISFDYESIYFTYVDYNGVQHRYYPDLIFADKNTIVEIKPKYLLNDSIVIKKMESAIDKGYKYFFLTEDNINDLEKYFKNINIV